MKLWPTSAVREKSKLEKRLESLPTHQVQLWADVYLNEVGTKLLEHTREGNRDALVQAEQSAATLLTVVQELRRR